MWKDDNYSINMTVWYLIHPSYKNLFKHGREEVKFICHFYTMILSKYHRDILINVIHKRDGPD